MNGIVGRSGGKPSSLDVIVVGGGPAGSVVARQLALAGWRVLVLERERFPRDKVCGEYLCPEAVAALANLGLLGALEGIPQRRVTRVRITSPAGHVVDGHFARRDGSVPYGISLARAELDHALLREAAAAGALVYEGARATDVQCGEDAAEVHFTPTDGSSQVARSALVIGADGRFSVVARRLGVAPPQRVRGRAVVHGQCRGVSVPPERVEMFLLPGRRYIGVNYLPNGIVNLSLVADLEEVCDAGSQRAEQLLVEALRSAPAMCQRFGSASFVGRPRVLAPLRVRRLAAHGERVLLVGDAAGFLDPLTGEGVHMALVTAVLAAETAEEALRTGRFGVGELSAYTRQRRRRLRAKLALDAFFQWLLGHPRLQDWLGKRFGSSREARDVLVSVVGNTLAPIALLRPRLLGHLLTPRALGLGPPSRANVSTN
ncbi:MAG: NAD(P)/FAD-dependent oxidoreductase [Planctomycetota bacterium]